MQPGFADATTAPGSSAPARSQRGDLAVTDLAGELGLQRRRTRRPRRSTDRRRRCRAGRTRRRARCEPRRAPSGRGAGDTDPARPRCGAVADVRARPCATSHSEKSLTRARTRAASGLSSRWPYSFIARAASRAVDDDRRVAGHRRDDAPGERACFGVAAGVDVQRAAAVAARPGRATRAPVARMTRAVARCVSRIHASMTQPVNSHASGAPPTCDVERAQAADRDAREAEPPRDEAQPLREPRATTLPRGAASAAAARAGTRTTRRLRASRCAYRGGGARRGCPPSGGRTARPTGTRLRSRGTARTRPSRQERVVDRCAGRSTARIAAIRPRGDAISRPVTR